MIDRDKYRSLFVEEAREHVDVLGQGLVRVETELSPTLIDELFRAAHSLKGAAGTLEYHELAGLSHALEDHLAHLRGIEAIPPGLADLMLEAADALRAGVDAVDEGREPGPFDALIERLRGALLDASGDGAPTGTSDAKHADFEQTNTSSHTETLDGKTIDHEPGTGGSAEVAGPTDSRPSLGAMGSTLRVPVDTVDRLVDLLGELRIAESRLDRTVAEVLPGTAPFALQESLRALHLGVRRLHDDILEVRTMSAATLLDRVPRLVRDMAKRFGKDVRLVMEGRDTTLDRSLLEAIGDPLLHLVRNALDHGIERPEERRRAGKPEQGTLTIQLRRDPGRVVVEVSDDGAGIDVQAVRDRAIERGLISTTEAADLGPAETLLLLTAPGLSTADTVTDVSGRGVGLDVVKTAVERIGGSFAVDSKANVGTTFRLRLPASLAVVEALAATIGAEPYYVPADSVVTSLPIDPDDRRRGVLVPPALDADDRADGQVERAARLLWPDEGAEPTPGRAAPIPIVPLDHLLRLSDRPRFTGSPLARNEALREVEVRAHRLPPTQQDMGKVSEPRARPRRDAPRWHRATRPTAAAREHGGSVGIVVERHGRRICLAVDGIGTVREIVVKEIQSPGARPHHVAGATVDADGSVALILDVASVLTAAATPRPRP